jgi:N-acetylmuramoyl-L-alanine amidase
VNGVLARITFDPAPRGPANCPNDHAQLGSLACWARPSERLPIEAVAAHADLRARATRPLGIPIAQTPRMNARRISAPGTTHGGSIVIDAGHGGDTPRGGSSPFGSRGPQGTLEKDVTLALARRIGVGLGARAVLTRHDDRNLSLAERTAIACRHGARVFLSIHANRGAPHERGAEGFVHSRATDASRALAGGLLRQLGRFGGGASAPLTAELAALTPEHLPSGSAACLLEVDYLSSPEGERRLGDARALDDLAAAIVRGVEEYVEGPRYGQPSDPAVDPSAAPHTTRPADPASVARELVEHYLAPHFKRLSDAAQRQLVQAWHDSPAAVIAGSALLTSEAIAFLIANGSNLPDLPAIPLDFFGDSFRGVELKLHVDGPLDDPRSFGFMVGFRARPTPSARKNRAASSETIDTLLPQSRGPDQIATEIDGPEFETEEPGLGPDSNVAANLGELVRRIGNELLSAVKYDPVRPLVELGPMPPSDYGPGFQRIVQALVSAVPSRLGSVEQVNFVVEFGGKKRWIPVTVRSTSNSTEAQSQAYTPNARGAAKRSRSPIQDARFAGSRYGDAVPAADQCRLEVSYPGPENLPASHRSGDPFRINNTYSSDTRVLFDNDVVLLEFDNPAPQNVRCRVKLTDDADARILCEAEIELQDAGKSYLAFSRFPTRADQVTAMNSCRCEVTVTNLYREREGVELWLAYFV